MSEMLGNQYFMARNFVAAHAEFEGVLLKDPCNKLVGKKQIICYTQIGEIKKALTLFRNLIDTDIKLITNTDPINDDCPCPEIIHQMKSNSPAYIDNEKNIMLGILWLYCDINESIRYFKMASKEQKEDASVQSILNKLQQYQLSVARK